MKLSSENQIYRIFVLLAISAIILWICAATTTSKDAIGESEMQAEKIDSGWYQVRDINDTNVITMPATLTSDENGMVHIAATLKASNGQDSFILFRTAKSKVKVYVNERIVYSYGEDDNIFAGKSPASRCHIVNVGRSFSRDKLDIVFYVNTPGDTLKINNVYEGTEAECIMTLIMGDLPNAFTSVILAIIGIIIIVCYIVFKKYLVNGRELLYIGLISLVTAIWSFTETSYIDFIFKNPNISAIIRYTSFTLIPLPMLLYIKESSPDNNSKVINAVGIMNVIVYIVSMALYVGRITDYQNIIIFTHIVLIITVFITAYNNIRAFIKEEKVGKKIVIGLASGIMVMAITIDLIRYYKAVFDDNAGFVRLALILYICIYALYTLNNLFTMAQLGNEAKALEQIAYTDLLTGVKNRAAFDRDLRELPASRYGDIRIVGFDVNNLKHTNDTYGHMAGDKLIIAAARIISEAFRNEGTCYRIGGDEFEVIMLDSTQRVYDRCCEKMDKVSQLVNSKSEYPIVIAYGDAVFDVDTDREFDTMIKRADAKMYEMKKRMKKQ